MEEKKIEDIIGEVGENPCGYIRRVVAWFNHGITSYTMKQR